MKSRGVALGAGAVVVLLSLAGCGAVSHPASRTGSPTPSHSATPVAAAHPGWPFAIGCSDIMSLDAARTATGGGAEMRLSDGDVGSPFGAAAMEGGALLCTWSDGEDGAHVPNLEVDVLPHATPAEQSAISADPVLDVSGSPTCSRGMCARAVLLGVNMAEVFWSSPAHASDADGGAAAFAPVLETIVSRLSHPGAESPPWSAPAGPEPQTYCDGGTGRPQYLAPVAAALGVPASTGIVGGGVGGDSGVRGVAVGRTDIDECAWQFGSDATGEYVSIWVLAGGSWAVAAGRAAASAAVPVDDPKHPGAYAFDEGHGNFSLVLASQGSRAEVDYEKQGATMTQAVAKMVAVAGALFP